MDRLPKGYTLAETALVLALAGLVAYAGLSTAAELGPKLRLRAGVWGVTSALQQARFRAVMSGRAVRVCFGGTGIVFERREEPPGSWTVARTTHLPGVRLAATNNPIFHPQGTVSPLASITVSNARGAYRVTIAISGRIRTTRLS